MMAYKRRDVQTIAAIANLLLCSGTVEGRYLFSGTKQCVKVGNPCRQEVKTDSQVEYFLNNCCTGLLCVLTNRRVNGKLQRECVNGVRGLERSRGDANIETPYEDTLW